MESGDASPHSKINGVTPVPSFLQTTFLAGLAALAVPVVIHLFFRLRTKRVELGTIRFLRVVLEENARRRKVMRWFLLMLRMACVALLVVLFARPYFSAAAISGEKELLVILLDRSATMQLKGERARLGRGEPRPRGPHERSKLAERLEIATPQEFGARRTELQPGRLRSPKHRQHRAGWDADGA